MQQNNLLRDARSRASSSVTLTMDECLRCAAASASAAVSFLPSSAVCMDSHFVNGGTVCGGATDHDDMRVSGPFRLWDL